MGLMKWFIATRPWSFTMTLVSVTFAATLAYKNGAFSIFLYIITLIGLIIFHAVTNIINDYFDVKHGVDRANTPTVRYRPHPLLTGGISKRSFAAFIVMLYAMVLSIAIYLMLIRGYVVMVLTLAGFLFSFFYTSDPVVIKHRSLGEIAVFLVWGPLMVGGAYYVISGNLSFNPSIASTPIGILVALVLLANNIRDIEYDSSVGVVTIAAKFGRKNGLRLYLALLTLVYLATMFLVVTRIYPFWSLLTLLTLPKARSIVKQFKKEVPDIADSLTAQLTLNYGIFLIMSELIDVFIPIRV